MAVKPMPGSRFKAVLVKNVLSNCMLWLLSFSTVVCERNNNGFRHNICFMVECYHKLIHWPLPHLSATLNLHHKFAVEMLSIRIREFFSDKRFR